MGTIHLPRPGCTTARGYVTLRGTLHGGGGRLFFAGVIYSSDYDTSQLDFIHPAGFDGRWCGTEKVD